MATFDPKDDQHFDASDEGGNGSSEFPFSVPDDDDGFDLDWTSDLGTDAADDGAFATSEAGPVQQPVAPPKSESDAEPVVVTRRKSDRDAGSRSTGRPKRTDGTRRGSIALGVFVTPNAVYGTLLQPSSDGVRVLRRFVRQRSASGEPQDLSGMVADTIDTDESDDVKVQFGEGGDSGSDLFLASEFGDLSNFADMEEPSSKGKQRVTPFVFELKDLLDECAAAGFDKPSTAFCVGQPAVDYVEVLVPEERKRDERQRGGDGAAAKEDRRRAARDQSADGNQATIKRDRLLARLADVYEEPFEKDRVAFVPMTAREGVRRFLAIVPTTEDALGESLELLREQSGMRSVPLRTADAEVPILVGLTRSVFPPEPHENTAIVRVGSENTLVILLQGRELHHQEHMLSVSTIDGPDTICSRVLLQQDVQGVGTVHQVIVVSEEREDELVRGFSAFYPDARVAALRRGLQEHGVSPPPGQKLLSARTLPAIGVALRLLTERQKDTPFEQVNMLPKRLRRTRPKLDLFIAWHTLVVGILLFFTVLFFVGLFFAQNAQISDAERRLAAYPQTISMSPQQLQTHIDSLQSVHIRITQTLNTIDSLLVGSDRWTRTLERLARATTATGGAWVGQWSPQAAGLQLSGYSTGRDQVVHFAERMNGTINELRFEDIRSYPVYAYVLSVPVPNELPEVARYLRDQVDIPVPEPVDPLGGALAGEELSAEPIR